MPQCPLPLPCKLLVLRMSLLVLLALVIYFGLNDFKGRRVMQLIYYDGNSLVEPAQRHIIISSFKGPLTAVSVHLCLNLALVCRPVCVFLYLYGKVFVLIVTPLGCRCMEQPSSSTSLTRRRTCQTVSAHSWACPA